jgi:pimeloyl-ACP methyl ester carboxylesterase
MHPPHSPKSQIKYLLAIGLVVAGLTGWFLLGTPSNSATAAPAATLLAQFSQQGPKLAGTGAVRRAQQGQSVPLSADGNTAIVGGLGDNSNAGAASVFMNAMAAQELNWIQKSPANSPPRPGLPVMAFDAARGQVVLFGGGSYSSGLLNDTWVWDGANWTQKSPMNSPPPRQNHAMAYDAARGQVLLFGGFNGSNLNDTWVWDGTTWMQKNPANSPSPSFPVVGMAYDAAREQVVMFISNPNPFAGSVFSDTWVWDGANWAKKNPLNSPPPRTSSGMAYDAARGQVVLFGGNDAIGLPSSLLNDTWVWDGTNWTQKSPTNSPTPRYGQALAFDSIRGQVVMFGGEDGSTPGDTWIWDGTNWTRKSPLNSPSPRSTTALAYDAARGEVVMFGGNGSSGLLNETWVFTASAPTPTPTPTPTCTIQPAITTQPQSRTIESGQTAALTVEVSETNPATLAFFKYQWFQGVSGDTSHPVTDTFGGKTYTTPPLTATTSYWVQVTFNLTCPTDSGTAVITVNPAQQRPLIFIPGLMGSSLDSDSIIRSNLWPGVFAGQITDHSILTLDPNKSQMNVIPNDAIDSVGIPPFESEIIYEPLLNFLTTTGGYHEYVVNGDPTRRTKNGCDLSQKGNNPDLFVFAYDWRFSNAENVAQLKDYVGCIQRFYPGTKVDVLTHSMGGLLARRYIIINPTDHAVDRLITIAAPWLGAPKAINVMETGEYDGLNRIVRKKTLKSLSEFFPSAHQLLPSRLYFGLGGRPFAKDGTISADYNQFITTFNAEFPRSSPVNVGKAFHDRLGQDDWRTDQSGVKYYHIYGQRHVPDTIGSVSNTTVTSRGAFGSKTYQLFIKVLTRGDQTVPILSAERRGIGPGLDFNAPGATLKLFANSNPVDDDLFEHTGLTKNLSVQNYILSILKPAQSAQSAMAEADEEPTVVPAYYVRVVGAGAVTVADTVGNTTNPLADLSDSGVPNVTTFVAGEKATQIVMPTDQTFSVTIRADGDPMSLEITKGSDVDTFQAIRYQDLSLPTGVTALLRFTPSGIDSLKYDADGDGTFETTVSPTASANGTPAQDVTPPSVNISATSQGASMLVTIAATDSESGIKTVFFSQDGTNFATYTGSFTVNPLQGPVVFAFADDNIANRSGIVIYYPSSTGNQVDNAQFFVRQHYLDFLNREPDASGLAFWTNEIASCGSNTQCQEVKRINVSAAFYLSIEFQQTGYLAYRAYEAAFGNMSGKPVPIKREEMLADMQQLGQGVVVGVGDWEQRLEQNKRDYFDQLVARERFTTLYPQTMTPEQFVDALNANAGGALSQAERDALVSDLKSSAKTRARVLQAVAEDADLVRAETNNAFVLMQYFGYLRRNPDDAPDTNFGGWQFWLGKLNQFNGNFVKAEMVKAFITSIEYRDRFSQ